MSRSTNDLNRLLDLLLDQQCDDEQRERLEQLLAEKPQLVDQYIDHVRLHSMLQWHCDTPAAQLPEGEHATNERPQPVPARPYSSRPRVIASLIATTAVVLLVVLGINSRWFDDSSPQVGWISDANGVIWEGGQEPLAEGASFRPGEIRTRGGRLELQFKSGATMKCDGPISIDVLSGMRVRVTLGKISVRVADSAKGFVVDTPDAEVVDLGTEFGVVVHDGEHTDVVVFDGEVDVQRKTTVVENPQRLTKGEAVRVNNHGGLQRIVQVNREPKTDSWSVGESGHSVIRSIRDNLRDPGDRKYYEIVPGGFVEDALAYVDRLHEWNGLTEDGLPAFLRGGDYVRTFNHDKSQSELEIRLAVSDPAMLYVLYDNRCPIPSWLSESFTDTNVDVGRDNAPRGKRREKENRIGPGKSIDYVASVWKLRVDEPREIVLGHVAKGPRGASAMHGIVVVPASREIVAPRLD